MPVHFSVFLQQVRRYCEKSLISRKVLPLRLYGQCSNAVSYMEFEVKDAAAGVGARPPPCKDALQELLAPAESTMWADYLLLTQQRNIQHGVPQYSSGC